MYLVIFFASLSEREELLLLKPPDHGFILRNERGGMEYNLTAYGAQLLKVVQDGKILENAAVMKTVE